MSDASYSPPGVDLSAFTKRASAVPPPPLPESVPAPAAPDAEHKGGSELAARRRAAPARRRKEPDGEAVEREGKVQFFVHLPPDQHAWLRERALSAGWPKREVVLEAFVAHRDQLRAHDPDAQRRSAAGLPPREPGRRKEVGGIPSNVYMGRAEAEVLDRHAREVGMSRSQMVSELLRLATAAAPEPARGPSPGLSKPAARPPRRAG